MATKVKVIEAQWNTECEICHQSISKGSKISPVELSYGQVMVEHWVHLDCAVSLVPRKKWYQKTLRDLVA